MSSIPRLYTPRLCLRGFTPADAERVRELAGHELVAQSTLNVPHPYPPGAAEAWIAQHEARAASGRSWEFAVTLVGTRTPGREGDMNDTGHVVGTISVTRRPTLGDQCGELGYWMGAQYWNRGFATEAAHAVLAFAFGRQRMERVVARHFARNPASGCVMQKLGMTLEPALCGAQEKDGELLEAIGYSLLREEWMVSGSWRRRAGALFSPSKTAGASLAQTR